MKTRYFQIIIICLLASIHLLAQNPCIQRYTKSDGLPSNAMVMDIFQDSMKFIWFAGPGGLARYDGSTFTSFGMKDGLSSYHVNMVFDDLLGRVWFNMIKDNKWNFLYKNKIFNEKNTPWLDSLADCFYSGQDEDSINYFISNSFKGICSLDKKNRIKKYHFNDWIYYFSKSSAGEFLIWTRKGLYKTRNLNQEPKLIFTIPSFRDFYVKGNKVYLGLSDPKTPGYKFLKYSGERIIDTIELPAGIDPYLGRDILEDSNGLLWIGTLDKVVCIKNKQVVHQFDIDGLRSIMEDHEGNIWISSRNGVYKIRPCYFSYKHYDLSNFQNKRIKGMNTNPQNPESGLWITTGGTQYLLKNNQIYDHDLFTGKLVFNEIYSLNNNYLVLCNVNNIISNYYTILEIKGTDPLTKKIKYKKIFPGTRNAFLPRYNYSRTEFCCYEYPGPGVIKIYSTQK